MQARRIVLTSGGLLLGLNIAANPAHAEDGALPADRVWIIVGMDRLSTGNPIPILLGEWVAHLATRKRVRGGSISPVPVYHSGSHTT